MLTPQTYRGLAGMAIVLLLVLGPYLYWRVQRQEQRNFRVVREGVLYRSGQMTLMGLKRAIHTHGIRTVITLRSGRTPEEAPPDREEEDLCRELGVKHFRLPARAWANLNGEADANAGRFCAVVGDPARHPVLVHCFAGKHRTGAYCAIYRIECEGWSNGDAIAEMAACGYETIGEDEDVREYLKNYRSSGRVVQGTRR